MVTFASCFAQPPLAVTSCGLQFRRWSVHHQIEKGGLFCMKGIIITVQVWKLMYLLQRRRYSFLSKTGALIQMLQPARGYSTLESPHSSTIWVRLLWRTCTKKEKRKITPSYGMGAVPVT